MIQASSRIQGTNVGDVTGPLEEYPNLQNAWFDNYGITIPWPHNSICEDSSRINQAAAVQCRTPPPSHRGILGQQETEESWP
jgi:hypothetical protein